MKTLLLYLIPFLPTLIGKGVVISDTPYEVHISDSPTESVRWEPWEWYQNYDIKVQKGDTITAYWISQCNGDTLATAIFSGTDTRKVVNDTIFLNGSTYSFVY